MRKIVISLMLAAFVFSFGSTAFAGESPSGVKLSDPGILPTNPFYFVKEIGWGIERLFTSIFYNPVDKVELELKITETKLSEIKKLSEINGSDQVIAEAATGYKDAIGRLQGELAELKDTSKNPEVDRLLDKVVSQSVIHQTLFDDLQQKHDGISNALVDAEYTIDGVMATLPAVEAEPEKFGKRILKVFDELGVTVLPPADATIRAVEVIGRLEDKVDLPVREKLIEIKDEYSGKAVDAVVNQTPSKKTLNSFIEYIRKQYPVKPEDIGPGHAELTLVLAKAGVDNLEANIKQAKSWSRESVQSILKRAKSLITEAEKVFGLKKYFDSWSKANKAMELTGDVYIPQEEILLPEPLPLNQTEPVPGDGIDIEPVEPSPAEVIELEP